jgi:hypothetical protein
MPRILPPLLAMLSLFLSEAAFPQIVTLSQDALTPSPQTSTTPATLHFPVVAKDSFGNIWQAATIAQQSLGADYYIAKYDRTGRNILGWTHNSSSSQYKDDEVSAIAVDRQGNVIVTGATLEWVGPGPLARFATTVKYDPNGTQIWTEDEFGFGGHSINQPTCIAADTAGNAIIAGTVGDIGAANNDFFIDKVTPTGSSAWSVTYDGAAGKYDSITAVAVDIQGNIYVTGASMGQVTLRLPNGLIETIPQGYDYETIKYSANGQLLWSSRYATNLADIPTALILDAAGNVYVTGSANGSGTTVCYNANGVRQWAISSSWASNYTSIALDGSGNIITAGYFINSGNLNYVLTKYTPAGSLVWSNTIGAGAGPYVPLGHGPYLGLAIDRNNDCYIAGAAIRPGSPSTQAGMDFWTLKYGSAGNMIWSQYYNGWHNAGDFPSGIALIESTSPLRPSYANIFIGGFANYDPADAGFNSLELITYSQTINKKLAIGPTAATAEIDNAKLPGDEPSALSLTNYPNPFHATTQITYTLPHDSRVTLQIFDASGRIITTPVDEDQPAGLHTLPFNAGRLAAGIYAYRLAATSPQGNFTSTKQMIIQ